ncbi:MAG: hypothetical protein HKO13_03550 [Sphingomonas sp.]|nr:hypothetical protein [Sphingomonas sp.]
MAIFRKILIILLALLSLAAGAAKVMLMPQEIDVFQAAGLGSSALLALGVLQILGSLMVVPAQFRTTGLWLITAGFVMSSLVIFATGNVVFGLISLIPPLLAGWLARTSKRTIS